MRGDHGLVNAKAVQIGLGVDACGRKEVLGMLIAESETAFMKLLHLAVKKVTQKCKRSSPFGDFTIKRLVIADGVPELHPENHTGVYPVIRPGEFDTWAESFAAKCF